MNADDAPVLPSELRLALPPWVAPFLASAPVCASDEERMDLAVALARRNVAERTGGPFGAAVFSRSRGTLLAAGVNVVRTARCSLAHAEMMALGLAQAALGTHRLDNDHVLATSAQPCAMCFGALAWSGVGRLLCGARREDVEETVGFDEGPLPDDWTALLGQRGIDVVRDVRRSAAREILASYAREGGALY